MGREPETLWCLKVEDRLFARVVGTYPYEVEIDLESGWNRCTCPLGGDCKHVRAALAAYDEGKFVEGEGWLAFEPSAVLGIIAMKNPELAVKILLKELELSLKTDESGSRSAAILWRIITMFRASKTLSGKERVAELFMEFRKTFEGYPALERIEGELASLGLIPRH